MEVQRNKVSPWASHGARFSVSAKSSGIAKVSGFPRHALNQLGESVHPVKKRNSTPHEVPIILGKPVFCPSLPSALEAGGNVLGRSRGCILKINRVV